MKSKRRDGHETWHRLLQWTKEQAPSERLAGHILRLEGYESLDPSHPLGGQDGLKDIIAVRNGLRWVAGAYFPRGQKSESAIQKKFKDDFVGVSCNGAQGFAFVTNQELRLAEREQLVKIVSPTPVEIYHLERISQVLDSPLAYGIRLEFLDIEMTREEQISLFSSLDKRHAEAMSDAFREQNRYLTNLITGGDSLPFAEFGITSRGMDHLYPTYTCLGEHPIFDVVVRVQVHVAAGQRNGYATDQFIQILYPEQRHHLPAIPGGHGTRPGEIYQSIPVDWDDLKLVKVFFSARNGQFVQETTFSESENGIIPNNNIIFRKGPNGQLTQIWRKTMEFVPEGLRVQTFER